MATVGNPNAYVGLFGADNNYSAIPATMLNSGASDSNDFGTIVTNGIKNAAMNAINGMINGAYADGQLQNAPAVSVSSGTMQMLVLGAVLFFVLAGKKS